MNNLISQIEVTNFRSIKYAKINCSEYNLFCGQNDVGKSNILKALNLFFNQETDFKTPFNFFTDYNKYALAEAQTSKKKKQLIKIKVIFKKPESYQSISGSTYFIEKTFDRNDKTGLGTIKYSEDSTKARTAISKLYNQMRYVYIPALKGKEVIQYLLGLLGEQELIGSTQIADLNKSINDTTNDLADLLNESKIGIGVSFGLPTLLSDFWQQLSVGTTYEYFEAIEKSLVSKKSSDKLSSSSYQIPLNMRGDGIKSKFLPPILKWLQKHNTQQTFIWGIDEPENSLEFRAAEELSYLFGNEYALTTQIFATSHSMAFINPRDTDRVKPAIFRTVRSSLGETSFRDINDLYKTKNREDLLEEIGALAIQKELITKFRRQIEEEKNAKKELENSLNELQAHIAALTKPLVITEGKTDIKYILKAKEKLGITDVNFEQIDSQHQPDGDSNLHRLLEQLCKVHNRNKIIGIFDRDVPDTIKNIEKDGASYKDYGNGVYAFCISAPQYRIDNNQTEISIEYLFTDNEIKSKLGDGRRLFLGTEFRKSSGRHKTEDLVFNKPQKRDIDKILDSSDGQAVYDRNENNVLATKNHFAEAVVNDQIEISNESWENFRHIFDKLKKICAL